MFSFIIIAFSTALAIIWSIPFVLAPIFGWQLYRITERTMINVIQKTLRPICTIITNDKPTGFMFGKWYVGYMMDVAGNDKGETSTVMFMLCRTKQYKSLTDAMTGDNKTSDGQKLTVYERYGCFFRLEYRKRILDVGNVVLNVNQLAIVDKIQMYYTQHSHVVAFVYGDAGCGKSMLAMLVALKLNGVFVQSFNPTDAGDSISELYHTVSPTQDKPLIILLDEVDVQLDMVMCGVPSHKYIPILVRNKIGWSMFFDNIDRGYYKYVIFVLTSNRTPKFYNDIDPAYLRRGRINITAKLTL